MRSGHQHRGVDRRQRLEYVIDEFGAWSYDRLAATALFSLISARYERGSIILTSNKGFGEWARSSATP